ncbi:MAG: RlmE family RNA methyltransferase [Desulfobacterales bacterium]|nr:MAG: RlmE family RNA methyltransferase [Desulfobacterales bacterium]
MIRAAAKRNRWEDHYARRARQERYPARSVYKLQEIQKKYSLIKKGDKVLDLGCSPGSWMLYAARLTGPAGQVVGIDLKPVTVALPPHVRIHRADILTLEDEALAAVGQDFNVVLSDLAPATTGNKALDAVRSFHLGRAALSIAQKGLTTGGFFVCKIFQGQNFEEFIGLVRLSFAKYKLFKPQSSRKASKEIYIIGFGKK